MTGAIECLMTQHPDKFNIKVDTSCNAIFENNPHVNQRLTHIDQTVKMQYPLIHKADHQPCHFLQGFVNHLSSELKIKIQCDVKRPYVYLSEQEKRWINQVQEETGYTGKFWLINSGYKNDYTIKKWHQDYWQQVVDGLIGEVQFVQVGSTEHNHKPLDRVINLLGKTSHRQLIRLAYHAQGCITPESYLHHLFAAYSKPCITLASGFLPVNWVRYHTGVVLTNQPFMSCCPDGKGCWKSRVVALGDGNSKDNSLCKLPIVDNGEAVSQCMYDIKPKEVIAAVKQYIKA
jgi:ADP-heptose:LPS heptosyltransferase